MSSSESPFLAKSENSPRPKPSIGMALPPAKRCRGEIGQFQAVFHAVLDLVGAAGHSACAAQQGPEAEENEQHCHRA